MAGNGDVSVRPDQPEQERAAWSTRLSVRSELIDVTCDLAKEFAPTLPAGLVIRHVAACREELLAAGVRAGLSEAVRAMARAQLQGHLAAAGGGECRNDTAILPQVEAGILSRWPSGWPVVGR